MNLFWFSKTSCLSEAHLSSDFPVPPLRLDQDGSGALDATELQRALKDLDLPAGDVEAEAAESTGVVCVIQMWLWVKIKSPGTADFSPCFLLPGFHLGTYF